MDLWYSQQQSINLFILPGMQHVVYAIEYKIIKCPCYNQLLFTVYQHD